MSQTARDLRTVNLRQEGRSVVFSIPAHVARELALKAGDMMMVRAAAGALIAVKVDLRAAVARVESGAKNGRQ